MIFDKISNNVRKTILHMITKSKSSHIGSAYSIVDMLVYLYKERIKYGDKLIFSKGHAGSALYATLAEMGKVDKNFLIDNYCQNGQKIGGHVTLGSINGVDATAGALGHGLSIGIGTALGNTKNITYVILGDGEINEGSIWEGFMFVPQKKINNLVLVFQQFNYGI